MKRFIHLLVIISLALGTSLQAKTDMADEQLWQHLLRRSDTWYMQFIQQSGGPVSPAEWKDPLDSAFIKLSAKSGHAPFNIQYCILKNDAFNAMALPGGQFFIFSGTLRELNEWAWKACEADGEEGRPRGIDYYRERAVAPLIAHEMAHYYNRHQFQSIRKMWAQEGKNMDSVAINMLEYSREHEFVADMTGCLLLKQAGYDTASMVNLLTFLNDLTQKNLEKGVSIANYLSSHPSGHARLANLEGGDKAFHAWAAGMEQAFENIQFGRNLNESIATIEKSLQKYPDNIYFLKAIAVGRHKLWLSTVGLKDQKLKAVIGLPGFRDNMVISARTTRGSGTPGNKIYYTNAIAAYEKVISQAFDPEFQSNYATLLCYSIEDVDAKKALKLAAEAAKSMQTFGTLSNFALVCYMNNINEDARKLYLTMAIAIDDNYTKMLGMSRSDPKVAMDVMALQDYMTKCQLIDKSFVRTDFTPLLNLALLSQYSGETEKAKNLAEEYLKKYESRSVWAKYLASATGMRIADYSKNAKQYFVNGIKPGDSIKTVLAKWKKPDSIGNEGGMEYWYYSSSDISLMIETGFVSQISLISKKSPAIGNKFGIGSSKQSIDALLGEPTSQAGLYYFYGEARNVAVQYMLGVATNIVLL